ncbi:50S ribosomal protein L29 [Candidatus Methylocalor cossyra]|uniref:Large ribosomal subunit protein uL29 n=1 Tax=Candidatus Methylocalor cossyra TaxID=3108543 RepID=A0ABM9NKQ2_9GAMM
MKAADLRQKTDAELMELLVDCYREQFNLRMQKAIGQLSKVHQIPQNRRRIARIYTILTERGIRK